MFLDDDVAEGEAGPSNAGLDGFTELPTGVITLLTKCYSPSCNDAGPCYSYGCPKRGQVGILSFAIFLTLTRFQIPAAMIAGPSTVLEPDKKTTTVSFTILTLIDQAYRSSLRK